MNFACWQLRGIAAALASTQHIKAETERDIGYPNPISPERAIGSISKDAFQ